jgi:glycosyltransferase involved in cell wall biosynthesis
MVDELNIQEKVIIKPRLPYTELMQYTCNANLGITLDKDTNINYHFSLPNKVFDYIQAGIPVLSSDLPELSYIIRTYNIGDFIENHTPKHIADKITEMVFNEEAQVKWKSNTTKAAQELCWENEELKLIEMYNKILNNEQ